jgi:hypothetical protein
MQATTSSHITSSFNTGDNRRCFQPDSREDDPNAALSKRESITWPRTPQRKEVAYLTFVSYITQTCASRKSVGNDRRDP